MQKDKSATIQQVENGFVIDTFHWDTYDGDVSKRYVFVTWGDAVVSLVNFFGIPSPSISLYYDSGGGGWVEETE